MIFNSIEFAFFLPIVFLVYWFVVNKELRYQNMWLVVASYFFYGWWDWRFLSLIAFSSLVDYFVGLQLGKEKVEKNRKKLMLLSVFVNLSFLGVFKYFNFFSESFADAFTLIGMPFDPVRLGIILPVGISFYTFQTLSYSIDIYKKKIEPTKDIVAFFAFVSFFPQLVAGPIERASNLLPQFNKQRQFSYEQGVDGLRQILWGLFKKVVIADNCATFVNMVFGNPEVYSGNYLLSAAFYFSIQIYCDFSGYSDIAIGSARLFGINLMQNFNNPYFSVNTSELWRRWHISLSTWFRDYVFNPVLLHFRKLKRKASYIATFLTFFLIGIWHGDNWTFVFFGIMQSLILMADIASLRIRMKIKKSGIHLPTYKFLSWAFTMFYWVLGCIVFRSPDLGYAWEYIIQMATNLEWSIPPLYKRIVYLSICILFIVEWLQKDRKHALEDIKLSRPLRWGFYLFLVFSVYSFGGQQQEFIYFQF